MEATGLSLVALALMGIGSAATVLFARTFPLGVLARAQEHGRYAGLSATPSDKTRGQRPGRGIGHRAAPSLKAA